MTLVQTIFSVVLIVLAVLIILLVMAQEDNQQGLSGALSGGSSDSFFGKNKGRTDEAKKIFATKILAGIFIVLVCVASIVTLFA